MLPVELFNLFWIFVSVLVSVLFLVTTEKKRKIIMILVSPINHFNYRQKKEIFLKSGLAESLNRLVRSVEAGLVE